MVASPAARRIQVTYDDGRQATIRLEEPSPNLEHEARLVHFRYAAFAVPGTWSVQRLVTLSASGRALWDSTGRHLSCVSGRGSIEMLEFS